MSSPWGWLLASYFVLVGVPSGLTLVLLALRAWWPQMGLRLAWVGMLTTLAALGVLGLLLVIDLGRPERFFLMLSRFGNLDSPISVGAKLITLKLVLLLAELGILQVRRRADPSARPADRLSAGVATLVTWSLGATSVALAVYPVAVLARTWVSPLAVTGSAGLSYLVTALLMGAAVLWPLTVLSTDPQRARALWRRGCLALLVVGAVVLAMDVVSVVDNARIGHSEVPTVGWVLVLGGLGLPLIGLLLVRRHVVVLSVCAVGMFVGAATGRYLIFAVGP